MTRLAGTAIGMAAAALVLGYLGFGWPVLLLGGPPFVGITIAVGVLMLTEGPRARLRRRRERYRTDSPWRTAAERGARTDSGLLNGFFEPGPPTVREPGGTAGEVPAPRPVLPPSRPADARRR